MSSVQFSLSVVSDSLQPCGLQCVRLPCPSPTPRACLNSYALIYDIWHIYEIYIYTISVQFSHSVVSNSLQPLGLQHASLPCPSPTPGASSNSCPSSRWHHSTISSSLVLFSSHLQSFPASGSSPMSQFFASGDQSIGASASHQSFQWIFRMDWLDLLAVQWTLKSILQHHSSKASIHQLSLWSNSHIHTWLMEKP